MRAQGIRLVSESVKRRHMSEEELQSLGATTTFSGPAASLPASAGVEVGIG